MHRDQTMRDTAGAIFAEVDVAHCYHARPPYSEALYERVLSLTPGRRRLLDLGCGPGKVAVRLASHFDEVVALDPSEPMLAEGRAIDAGRHANIVWTLGKGETYEDDGGFDLVTAGTSIHWPDHAVLFPRLARWTQVLAVISQDDMAPAPCGQAAWVEFLERWLSRMAERTPGVRKPYDPGAFFTEGSRHEDWIDIQGRETFAHTWRQPLEQFVIGNHSRATWSRSAMGELAAGFDAELTELMLPFATDGMLELSLVSQLTWGAPRTTPRG